MSRISAKKQSQLYNVVSDEIMNARVEINMKLKGVCSKDILNDIDNILSDLTMHAPQKAIDLFTVNKKKNK